MLLAAQRHLSRHCGKKIAGCSNASAYNLNIASLYAGNYLMKIEVNGEVVTKQFVKE